MLTWIKRFFSTRPQSRASEEMTDGVQPQKKNSTWQERAAAAGGLVQPRSRELAPPGKNSSQEERDQWLHASRMRKLTESQESEAKYGFRTLHMHLSALGPDTRKSHAERHGRLFTEKDVKEFWANPMNRRECRCTTVPIMVDEEGKPLVEAIQRRALENLESMRKRGYQWSKPD